MLKCCVSRRSHISSQFELYEVDHNAVITRGRRLVNIKTTAVVLIGGAAILPFPALADTIFNFTDEYYVSTLAQYNTAFGTTAGYNGAGIYQKTNTTTPTVTELHANSSSSYQPVPGEFVQKIYR
jgi:hypothetical protein